MATFYPLKVKEAIKETDDAISIKFDVPEDLKDKFEYKHGQYLTLKVEVDGESARRAYSLCSSPVNDADPMVTSKRVKDGLVSNYLNDQISEGDTIEVFPPMGKFTIELDPSYQRSYVLIAGGSGITPMMSILKTVLSVESQSMVFLLYGNYDESSIIFKEKLEDLSEKYGDRLQIMHTLSNPSDEWKGEKGMLDKSKCLSLLDKAGIDKSDKAEYFICGPGPMMQEAKNALGENDIPEEKVHIEYFTAPLPDLNKVEEEKGGDEEEEDFDEAEVEVLLDGETHNFKMKKEEKILEAAMDNEIDPPYACQMGICTTCKAFLHEGKVEMEENEGLTDQEIEEGYILTCQSHPKSAKLKVEYE